MHRIPYVLKIRFFLQKTFFLILWQILKLEVYAISHSLYVRFEIYANTLMLCKLHTCLILNSQTLDILFPKSSIDSKLGFFVLILGYTFKFFPINKKIFGFSNVALAGLLNFSQLTKKMKN